jgi:hypothetical protein
MKYINFKELKNKLNQKNRLIILNDETFEEIFSFRINIYSFFVGTMVLIVLLVITTVILIAFTPVREFIPGYASSELTNKALELAIKTDSLELVMKKNNLYIESMKKVLTGDLEYAKVNADSILAGEIIDPNKLQLKPTDAELELRTEIEEDLKKLKKK